MALAKQKGGPPMRRQRPAPAPTRAPELDASRLSAVVAVTADCTGLQTVVGCSRRPECPHSDDGSPGARQCTGGAGFDLPWAHVVRELGQQQDRLLLLATFTSTTIFGEAAGK